MKVLWERKISPLATANSSPTHRFTKKHFHSEAEEIMYILKGRGISGVNETETEISAGDTVWVPRGAVHWFYNPFDEPCEFIFIYTRKSLKDAGYEMVDES